MQTYLRYAIYAGLFGVLFIPFIVANDFFFPFITGKNFAFRIIIDIVFALWLILALRDPSVRPKKTLFLYALGAFVVSLGISTLFAEGSSKAFWSNFERMEGYIGLLHMAGYYLVVSSMLTTEKMWNRFWNTSIGVSVLLALFGVGQLAGWFAINQGGVRVDATFGNATYLAIYMLFHVFLTLYVLVRKPSARWLQAYYAAAIVLQVLMIFYAATRGTILGLVGGLFLSGAIFVVFGKGSAQLRKFGAAIALALVLLAGGFVAIKDTAFVRNNDVLTRVASISLSEGHVRFMVWGMAWQGFKERPIFGWGQEGFNYVFNKYYNPGMYAQEPWFDRAHNAFIDWVVSGGIVGFALYLVIFFLPLWYLWKKENAFEVSERALFTGLLAGYAVHNFFVFDNLMSSVLFFTVLAFIVSRHASEKPPLGSERTLAPSLFGVSTIAIVVVMGAVLYTVNVPSIARATGIIGALKQYCINAEGNGVPCHINNAVNSEVVGQDLNVNFEHFKKALAYSGIGRQEAYEQLIQFATKIRAGNLTSISTQEFRDDVARYAITAFGEEVDRAPKDARLRLFYGSFFRQLGLYDQAKEQLEKAHELSPTKQAILFELGLLYSDQRDLPRALPYFKQAYELDTAYDQARSFYAATAIRTGARDTADALLIERYGTTEVDDPFILQAYLDAGEIARVVAIAERHVRENPDDIQGYVNLAAAYLQANRRSDAIATLQAAIAHDPSFEPQGQQFIQQIQSGHL